MRICFVVHRYGENIGGGAENACRMYALGLAERGHDVHVLTSCARSYLDWANVAQPGTSFDGAITVHRLATSQPRLVDRFAGLSTRVLNGDYRAPFHVEREWMLAQGPLLPELVPWLAAHASGYDVVVFFTYLYYPTWAGVPAVCGRAPVVVHPTAHGEPPFYLSIHRSTFAFADALVYLSPEEAELVEDTWHPTARSAVIGIGVDLDVPAQTDTAFREAYGLGPDEPYLLCVGRVDPSKGTPDLVRWFSERPDRGDGLRLVLLGDRAAELELPTGVVATGLVDDAMKDAALAGALALVSPSRFESFSIVLAEAWAHAKPVIVRAQTPVLAGQVRRSGGGIAYRDHAELEAACRLLLSDRSLAAELGARGLRYVREHYAWPTLLDRYEQLLARAGR